MSQNVSSQARTSSGQYLFLNEKIQLKKDNIKLAMKQKTLQVMPGQSSNKTSKLNQCKLSYNQIFQSFSDIVTPQVNHELHS
jgi:hypothetical protein